MILHRLASVGEHVITRTRAWLLIVTLIVALVVACVAAMAPSAPWAHQPVGGQFATTFVQLGDTCAGSPGPC